MRATVVTLATVAVGVGLWLTVTGLRPRTVVARPAVQLRLAEQFGLLPGGRLHAERHMLAGALLVGVVCGLITGWYSFAVMLPVAAVGLPALFRRTASSVEVERLADLTAWVRSLVGVLSGGAVGLEQAIRATVPAAPVSVRPGIARIVARLEAQQPIKGALRRWADEMCDYSADLIAAALILESDNRTGAICPALRQLAGSLAAQAKARREIETERASGRASVRWVTIVTLAVIAGASTTGYLDGYGTPSGQVIALILFAAYVGCLIWMRRISMGRPVPRFLSSDEGVP